MLADTHEKSIVIADLRQESFLGLYEAAQRYDDTLGMSFHSLAYIWCRKFVLHAMHKYSTPLTVPVNFNWPEELKMLHLDETMKDWDIDAEDDGSLADRILYQMAEEEQTEREAQVALAERLERCMEGLTRKERQALIHLYGLDGKELNGRETAALLHITPGRVAKIKERALCKMGIALSA